MGTSSLILPAIFGDGICWIAKIGIDGILTDPRYSIKDTLEPAKWLKKRKEYKERIRAKYLHQLDKKQRAYSNSTDLAIAEDEPDPKNDMLQVFINEVKNMEFLRYVSS